jgi:hypothetical protein
MENTMPVIFDTGALLRPAFDAAEFIATKWDGPADKAAFANTLCRFMAADFKQSLWTKTLYRRLSLTFGHIAHTDSSGFYGTFFENLQGKVEFLEQTSSYGCYSDPEYTYCDVERAVIKRLTACHLLGAYRAMRAAEREGAEREMLRRLQQKYDSGTAPQVAPKPILHPGPAPVLSHRRKPAEQPSLI